MEGFVTFFYHGGRGGVTDEQNNKYCQRGHLKNEKGVCNPCRAEYMREWNKKNPGKSKEQWEKHKHKYLEGNRARVKQWTKDNKERHNAKQRELYHRNIEHHREISRKHALKSYHEHRDKHVEKLRQNREDATKSYISICIGLPMKDITSEQINAHREYIMNYRKNKQTPRPDILTDTQKEKLRLIRITRYKNESVNMTPGYLAKTLKVRKDEIPSSILEIRKMQLTLLREAKKCNMLVK